MKKTFYEIMRQLKLFSKEREGLIDFDYTYLKNKDELSCEFALTLKMGESDVLIKEKYVFKHDQLPSFPELEDRFFESMLHRLIKIGIIATFKDLKNENGL